MHNRKVAANAPMNAAFPKSISFILNEASLAQVYVKADQHPCFFPNPFSVKMAESSTNQWSSPNASVDSMSSVKWVMSLLMNGHLFSLELEKYMECRHCPSITEYRYVPWCLAINAASSIDAICILLPDRIGIQHKEQWRSPETHTLEGKNNT